MNKPKLIDKSTLIWLILILLSSVAALIGEFSNEPEQLLIPLLVILIVKAQLIVDYFMGLKSVKTFWRFSMSAFSVVICGIILGVL